MSGPRIIDISPVVSERTAVWPGDVEFRRRISMSQESGDNIDLSAITTTVHVGAHADAPSHYAPGGAAMAEVPLDPYFGPCQVIEADVGRGARILPEDLRSEVTAPRVLLRTGTFPDPEEFNT
ncbi:MAG: cyclase family protein, partial [Planctomycetota bacterium]